MRNRIYFGDNPQILREFPSQSVDLVYIDPTSFGEFIFFQIDAKTTTLSAPKLSSIYLVVR